MRPGILDDLAPLRRFGLDVGEEFGRRVDHDIAAVRIFKAGKNAQKRRLAGSAGTDDRQAFGPSQAFQKYREESWHDLRAEPESEGFFSVIRHQRLSKDYRDERSRRRLTKRVWDMIEAAALDTPLREKLFKQIVSPDDCGDLGAQLFNSLGMKVLVSKAYEESHTPEELDTRLVRLARSAARLQHVSEAAARTEPRCTESDLAELLQPLSSL